MIPGDDELDLRGERTGENLIIVRIVRHEARHVGGLHEDGNVQIALQQFTVGEPAALHAASSGRFQYASRIAEPEEPGDHGYWCQ